MSKKDLYFRRTNQSAYFNDDSDLVFGIEGVCGECDTDDITVETVADKNSAIEKLLATGYVETKPKERLPQGIDDYYDEDVLEAIVAEIEENEMPQHLSIITWDGCCECDDNDDLIEYFVENYDKYKEIEYFTFGDMDFEVCEISWIEHGDYTEFFKKYNHIKGFSVQGTSNITLNPFELPKLEILEVEGSGLDAELLLNIGKSKLPNLKKLNIWFGDESYGCDVTADNVNEFFKVADFPNLVSLGLCNVDKNLFSGLLKELFDSSYISKIKALDISKSVSLDADVDFLVEVLDKAKELKYIDMHYNYLTAEAREKLQEKCDTLGIELDVSSDQDIDEEDFEYSSPMYSE